MQIQPLQAQLDTSRPRFIDEVITDLMDMQNGFGTSPARRIALIDVDGVMENCEHRLPHIIHDVDGKRVYLPKPNWEMFHSLAHLDTPGMFYDIAQSLGYTFSVVFLTARVAFNAEVYWTLHRKLALQNGEPHHLMMRPPGKIPETKPGAVEFKRHVVKSMQSAHLDIAMAVDDSHENCKMFAEERIPTLRFYNHLTPTMYEY